MEIKLFNTLSREKEVFVPIKKGEVGAYMCGPTVYNYAHIGNLRTYIFEDLLRRMFEYNKLKVKHVMNITDVGHLTSDADSGEDKMLKGAKREGKTVWEIAEFYTQAFFSDMKKLHLLMPVITCKATEHIQEMIDLVKKLEDNGYTYTAGGNVYYDISKFSDYGKMARINLEDQESGARVEKDPNKKNHGDFVLWFTKGKFSDQEMQWDSPWGRGYPGWHIECSAMSMKYLGESFDIHCGGIDHIPVHHTNEIAQSEGATGKKWVNFWMHGEFLVIDKGKMAKSGENFLTLQSLIDKGYDPLAYRYYCMGAHYRTQLEFSFEALDGAQNALNKLRERVIELKGKDDSSGSIDSFKERFSLALNDDLDMPKAMAVVWDVLKTKDLGSKEKLDLLLDFDSVLGLGVSEMKEERVEVPVQIQEIIDKRENARVEKDWTTADALRDELKEKGYELLDGADGVKVRKV